VSPKVPAGLAVAIRGLWDRLEASKLPRLQTSEIVGGVTIGCLIFLLVVLRWLSA
jgi:hypothetical protein